jgi:hypothetical protein
MTLFGLKIDTDEYKCNFLIIKDDIMKKIYLLLLAVGAFSLVGIMPGCDGRGGSQTSNSGTATSPSNNSGVNQNQNQNPNQDHNQNPNQDQNQNQNKNQ